jgi:hypothetical protein
VVAQKMTMPIHVAGNSHRPGGVLPSQGTRRQNGRRCDVRDSSELLVGIRPPR